MISCHLYRSSRCARPRCECSSGRRSFKNTPQSWRQQTYSLTFILGEYTVIAFESARVSWNFRNESRRCSRAMGDSEAVTDLANGGMLEMTKEIKSENVCSSGSWSRMYDLPGTKVSSMVPPTIQETHLILPTVHII
jgi:hypothetical protein